MQHYLEIYLVNSGFWTTWDYRVEMEYFKSKHKTSYTPLLTKQLTQ